MNKIIGGHMNCRVTSGSAERKAPTPCHIIKRSKSMKTNQLNHTIHLDEELPRNMEWAPGTISIISPSGRKRIYRLSEPSKEEIL